MRHGFFKKTAAMILAAAVVVSGYAGAGYVLAEELEVTENQEAAPVAETEEAAQAEEESEKKDEPEKEEAEKEEPETAAPETTAPETSAPETAAPETVAQTETTAPETTAPAETTAPETAAPVTEAATEATSAEAVTEAATTEETTEAVTEEKAVSEENTEETTEAAAEETTAATTEEMTGEVVYKTDFSYENDEVMIIAKVSEEAQLPENAELYVEKLLPGSAEYEEAKQASMRDLDTAEDAEYNFYDVEFYADGEKIEVADGLATIRISFKNVNVSEENQTQSALYIEETETGAVARDVTAEAEVGSAVGSVEFQF